MLRANSMGDLQKGYEFTKNLNVIRCKSTGDLIGHIGCVPVEFEDSKPVTASIGANLLEKYTRRGIVSNMLPRVVKDYLKKNTKLDTIILTCNKHNEASKRISNKLGFEKRVIEYKDDKCRYAYYMEACNFGNNVLQR